MIDIYRWQVSQGRFFVHQHSGNVPLNAEFLCNEIGCGVSYRLVEDFPHDF